MEKQLTPVSGFVKITSVYRVLWQWELTFVAESELVAPMSSDSLPRKVDTRIDMRGRHFSVPITSGARPSIGSGSSGNAEHGEDNY
ncbi:hypothetical protein DYH10_03255 [Candidatus Saccharibacteria bacterium CPR2]|nr:hypothetical protein [Candidatus Saccharibacteria bacterium CPR2]